MNDNFLYGQKRGNQKNGSNVIKVIVLSAGKILFYLIRFFIHLVFLSFCLFYPLQYADKDPIMPSNYLRMNKYFISTFKKSLMVIKLLKSKVPFNRRKNTSLGKEADMIEYENMLYELSSL